MKVSHKDKLLTLLMALYMGFMPSCTDDNPADSGKTPPTIPSPATMQIAQQDLDFFKSGNLAKDTGIQDSTKVNWAVAAVIVTTFNAAVFLGLSAPVVATAAALSVDPVLESDGKFHWRFTHSENILSYNIHLTGAVLPTLVNWEMFVTSTVPPLENFLWYDGQTQLDGNTGHWQFYDAAQPDTQNNQVRIDWRHASDTDISLAFLNNKTGSPGFNNTLTYTVKDDSVSVAFVKASSSDSTRVAWNRQTGEGYIILPNINKGCWNSNQEDTVCSN